MRFLDTFLDYIDKSSSITIAVLLLLSLYFIVINWIFFYRYILLKSWIKKEDLSLHSIMMGAKKPSPDSILLKCFSENSKESAEFCKFAATKEATKGLTFLSIAASTSPFIGLFGTVISILQAFSMLGGSKASVGVIAPAIGEALIATAAGIFVATFAYTYHLFLKRKGFELVSYIQMQTDLLLSKKEWCLIGMKNQILT